MTIGHSNRPIDEFLAILQAHQVALLADVRTVPRSAHNPQFNRETLPGTLTAADPPIAYVHMAGLGGLRKPRADSINTGWRHPSFRGQTPAFTAALEELLTLATERRTCIMCAESVPWRCHRSLIGDALIARGIEVIDLMSETKSTPHKLTPFAEVVDGRVTYPGLF